MLWSGWCRFLLWLHIPPVFFQAFWDRSKLYQLQLVSPHIPYRHMVSRDSAFDNFASSFFFLLLLIIIRSGLLSGIRWSVCMLKSYRRLCVSFSRTGAGLCIYHLLVWSNLNFLLISQWITLPTQSCVALYSFCLICCIRLCDWSFRLCHRIANIYCFVATYLFSLWYDWSLWRCPVLLFGEILFIIIIIYTFRVFRISDSLPLEFEWHQVSSSLQDSSQYSCPFQ